MSWMSRLMVAGVMPCSDIIGMLLVAPPIGLGHGALHRSGLVIGIEDHLAVDIARRAADGLHQ